MDYIEMYKPQQAQHRATSQNVASKPVLGVGATSATSFLGFPPLGGTLKCCARRDGSQNVRIGEPAMESMAA